MDNQSENSENPLKNQLLAKLNSGKKALKELDSVLYENLTIRGQLLSYWTQHLKVFIPSEASAEDLERFASEIGNKIQEAENLLGSTELIGLAVHNLHDKIYSLKFVDKMDSSKRGTKMAAEKLSQMTLADEDVEVSLSATQVAELKQVFIKRIVEGLKEARKALETRSWLIQARLRGQYQ